MEIILKTTYYWIYIVLQMGRGQLFNELYNVGNSRICNLPADKHLTPDTWHQDKLGILRWIIKWSSANGGGGALYS